jgi:hypothetical protein
MRKAFLIFGLCMCAASCSNRPQSNSEIEYIDSVSEALADNGTINLDHMAWTREPAAYSVQGDTVTIIHRSFEYLNALTLGMDPAYRQTSVNVRELVRVNSEKTEEELRREQQQREQQQREQDEREKELRVMRAYERRSRELQIASFRMKSNY